MRPFLALYIGGMGSRERNFYTEQAGRYGFEGRPARSRSTTWPATAARPWPPSTS